MAAGSCVTCGGPLPPVKSGGRRRYCEVCTPMKRNKPTAAAPAPIKALPTPQDGKVVAATLATLRSAGREETVAGAAALALAEILDAGSQSGSSAAALVKELRATMDEALAGVRTTTSLVDELRARRDAKRGA